MDFFSSNLLGDSSTPGSNSSHPGIHEIIVGNSVVSEENLQKVESVLDLWSSGLKTNVISELTKWRLNFIDWHRMEMKKEKDKHAAHLKQLCNQINSLKELQKAYEISIGRKDEAYEGKLADQYFQRNLLKKVWIGWHSTVQKKWKDVVERACQARAEEVCVQISNDYENKVAVLSGALENAKAEIQRMQHEKEHFEDSMKKAFMRGVCALNLEAMTMFQNRNDADFTNSKKEEYGPVHLDPSATITSGAAPAPSSAAAAMGVASTAAFPSATSITSAGTASASCVSAPLGAGSTAPTASGETQTIPQAAATKYPRTIHPESTTSASRSLGTRSTHTQSLTSVHSIKVVD